MNILKTLIAGIVVLWIIFGLPFFFEERGCESALNVIDCKYTEDGWIENEQR